MEKLKWWERIVLVFIKPSISINYCLEPKIVTVSLIKKWRGDSYLVDQFEIS